MTAKKSQGQSKNHLFKVDTQRFHSFSNLFPSDDHSSIGVDLRDRLSTSGCTSRSLIVSKLVHVALRRCHICLPCGCGAQCDSLFGIANLEIGPGRPWGSDDLPTLFRIAPVVPVIDSFVEQSGTGYFRGPFATA